MHYLTALEDRSLKWVSLATMTLSQGWVPSEALRENLVLAFSSFPRREAARIPQLVAPSSSFKAATSGQVFPLLSLWFSLLISNSTFRDPSDYIGPTQTTQNNLPILKAADQQT